MSPAAMPLMPLTAQQRNHFPGETRTFHAPQISVPPLMGRAGCPQRMTEEGRFDRVNQVLRRVPELVRISLMGVVAAYTRTSDSPPPLRSRPHPPPAFERARARRRVPRARDDQPRPADKAAAWQPVRRARCQPERCAKRREMGSPLLRASALAEVEASSRALMDPVLRPLVYEARSSWPTAPRARRARLPRDSDVQEIVAAFAGTWLRGRDRIGWRARRRRPLYRPGHTRRPRQGEGGGDRELAQDSTCDASTAYTDSITDLALLEAVATPSP